MGSSSFDFLIGANNLYNPMQAEYYKVPNGLSLRPLGKKLIQIYKTFKDGLII